MLSDVLSSDDDTASPRIDLRNDPLLKYSMLHDMSLSTTAAHASKLAGGCSLPPSLFELIK